MESIMTFTHVRKTFGDVVALNELNFSIPSNSIFGLLGPNGAGKTTLIRIITKIFAADAGEIIFNGASLHAQQYAAIGYMPEEKGMYKKMKVGEHLIYLAQLKGLKKSQAKERIHFWFNKLDVKDWWNKKVEDLSKGMQQKLQFIATVLHEPDLLILDEPFSGLDPVNAELIKNEIYNLHKNGTTIIFSTHRMEQVEEICKNIVLINKGNVVITGEVKQIKENFKKNIYSLAFRENISVEKNNLFKLIDCNQNKLMLQLNDTFSGNDVLHYFIEQKKEITSFVEVLPSLNEIFIQLVKADNHA